MLKLTRLNRQTVVVNPDHICSVDATPDTTLKLLGGERIIVRELVDELIDLVVAYRRRIHDVGAASRAAAVAAMTDRHDDDAHVDGGR